MADFNKPATTDTYANVLAYLKATISDLALGMDPANTTPTNVPTNAVRWNSANNRFEKYNGTTWAALSATWAFADIAASGSVTLSGGTANGVPYLNASKVLTSGSALTFDGTNFATTGGVILDNAKYYYGKTAAGPTIRLLGINAGNVNYVGAIDSGPTDVIFGAASTVTNQAWYVGGSEQMRLTSTGLGIGTSSPGYKLDVNGYGRFSTGVIGGGGLTMYGDTSSPTGMLLTTSGNLGLGVTPSSWSAIKAIQVGTAASFSGGSGFNDAFTASNAYYDGTNWKYINTNPAYYASVGGSAAARWYTAASGTAGAAISFTQAMTLDSSGNLGVGTSSPSAKVEAQGNNVIYSLKYASDGGSALLAWKNSSGTTLWDMGGGVVSAQDELVIRHQGTQVANFSAAGNIGLGVTPSAWGSSGNIDLRDGAGISFGGVGGVVVSNAYYNAGWKYKTSQYAVKYDQQQNVGAHFWYVAPSGTAGNAITFTQAMTLFNSGGLSLGNTTDPGAGNLSVNGTISAGGSLVTPLVQATSQLTSSGTAKDFTGIPSWVKRITVMFQAVSTTGSANIIVQLGTSGGFLTSSYLGGISSGNNAIVTSAMSSGFTSAVTNGSSAFIHGQVILTNHNGNVWTMSGITHHSETTTFCFAAGSVSLSGVLTQIRITTVGGFDNFDAGSVNIIYE